jgi:hypothetical protein
MIGFWRFDPATLLFFLLNLLCDPAGGGSLLGDLDLIDEKVRRLI